MSFLQITPASQKQQTATQSTQACEFPPQPARRHVFFPFLTINGLLLTHSPFSAQAWHCGFLSAHSAGLSLPRMFCHLNGSAWILRKRDGKRDRALHEGREGARGMCRCAQLVVVAGTGGRGRKVRARTTWWLSTSPP